MPVTSFAANPFGLHDVLGNVWELVEDCWHGNYIGAPDNGRAWTAGGDCDSRVMRGGSWFTFPGDILSFYRLPIAADERRDQIGFRVARDID